MMDIFSGATLFNFMLSLLVLLPIGVIVSLLTYRFFSIKQTIYFLSSWAIIFLGLGVYINFLKDRNNGDLKILLIGIFISIFFLFLSYRKTKSFWKTTGIILLNLAILSLAIFLLNRQALLSTQIAPEALSGAGYDRNMLYYRDDPYNESNNWFYGNDRYRNRDSLL